MYYAYKAFQILPRKEPYYHVARYFDKHEGDEATALLYNGLAAKAPKLPSDVPFGEANIYALDIEKSTQWPKTFPPTYGTRRFLIVQRPTKGSTYRRTMQ